MNKEERNNKKNGSKNNSQDMVIISLYVAIAGFVVVAGIFSVMTFMNGQENVVTELEENTTIANSSDIRSYKTPDVDIGVGTNNNTLIDLDELSSDNNTSKYYLSQKDEESNENEVDEKDTATAEKQQDEKKEPTEEKEEDVSKFLAFDESQKMNYPIVGEVIVPYSEDLIYDPTLEQYRTNDNISIASVVGEDVRASATGEVVETGLDEANGYYVVISHGNGWKTTYSQLQKDIVVNEGDIVEKSQVIGHVEAPTRRYSALDPHITFVVTKGDEAVDPGKVLVSNEL